MKNITFVSNYGNFATEMKAQIGEDVNPATTWLCETQGLGNLQYRMCGSRVDKALGVKTKENRKYEKRVEVPYSAANSAIIEKAVREALDELAESEASVAKLGITFRITGQHEYGSTDDKPTKEATALWTAIQALPEAKFNEKLKVLGLDADYTDETAIIAVRDALRKARQEAADAAKAKLGL